MILNRGKGNSTNVDVDGRQDLAVGWQCGKGKLRVSRSEFRRPKAKPLEERGLCLSNSVTRNSLSRLLTHQCHQHGIFPVRVSRGTEPCDGVEQKTCLSGASLFCVRHRASTGVCLRSRPNGVGARGSPEGCRVTPLWARPARTSTLIGVITGQVSRESSGGVPPSLLALPKWMVMASSSLSLGSRLKRRSYRGEGQPASSKGLPFSSTNLTSRTVSGCPC